MGVEVHHSPIRDRSDMDMESIYLNLMGWPKKDTLAEAHSLKSRWWVDWLKRIISIHFTSRSGCSSWPSSNLLFHFALWPDLLCQVRLKYFTSKEGKKKRFFLLVVSAVTSCHRLLLSLPPSLLALSFLPRCQDPDPARPAGRSIRLRWMTLIESSIATRVSECEMRFKF